MSASGTTSAISLQASAAANISGETSQPHQRAPPARACSQLTTLASANNAASDVDRPLR